MWKWLLQSHNQLNVLLVKVLDDDAIQHLTAIWKPHFQSWTKLSEPLDQVHTRFSSFSVFFSNYVSPVLTITPLIWGLVLLTSWPNGCSHSSSWPYAPPRARGHISVKVKKQLCFHAGAVWGRQKLICCSQRGMRLDCLPRPKAAPRLHPPWPNSSISSPLTPCLTDWVLQVLTPQWLVVCL